MPKRIRDYPVNLAPSISGVLKQGMGAIINDEITGRELNLHDIDDKIFIYERQVNEWFLNRAKSIVMKEEFGFIVLMICMSYLEGIEQYRNGRHLSGGSKQTYVKSIKRIFGEETFRENDLENLYKYVRCSLFHSGMSDGQLLISNYYNNAIKFEEDDTILINPRLLLDELSRNFSNYIVELRNSSNVVLRQNFEYKFRLDA